MDFEKKKKKKKFLHGKNNTEIFLRKENCQIGIYYIDWIIGRKLLDFENFSLARSHNFSTETL